MMVLHTLGKEDFGRVLGIAFDWNINREIWKWPKAGFLKSRKMLSRPNAAG